MKIQTLVANPFQVNTYLVSDANKDTIIIDPACSNEFEQQYFLSEIEKQQLNPVKILLTHGHIDHILGCGFMQQHFGIDVYAHQLTEYFLAQAPESADMFGLQLNKIPKISHYLDHGDVVVHGNLHFDVFHTPGHASGSLCFYSAAHQLVFTGDVLFKQSIGRTDLPTGDMDTLMEHIREYLMVLPPETVVYPGHGPETTIEDEIRHNPFITE
jgi:hydroxyacylglutathione hydrolase